LTTRARFRGSIGTGALVVLACLAAVALSGCGGGGGSAATKGSTALAAALAKATPSVAPFDGLTATHVQVGRQCLHVVVADSEAEREEGLRARTDLGPYDGMLFVFPGQGNVAFTMSGTLVPLTIGFYDASGRRVDGLRMTPCPGDDASCPVYRASGMFTYAIETTADRLPAGGIAPCP
jgi:uncharacterized membrane protein (UPF0127 family)